MKTLRELGKLYNYRSTYGSKLTIFQSLVRKLYLKGNKIKK